MAPISQKSSQNGPSDPEPHRQGSDPEYRDQQVSSSLPARDFGSLKSAIIKMIESSDPAPSEVKEWTRSLPLCPYVLPLLESFYSLLSSPLRTSSGSLVILCSCDKSWPGRSPNFGHSTARVYRISLIGPLPDHSGKSGVLTTEN